MLTHGIVTQPDKSFIRFLLCRKYRLRQLRNISKVSRQKEMPKVFLAPAAKFFKTNFFSRVNVLD